MPDEADILQIEWSGDVTLARFDQARVVGTQQMKVAYLKLLSLVTKSPCAAIELDFRNIKAISSESLGKLIDLHKTLSQLGTRLFLVNVAPQIFEEFDDGQASVLSRLLSPKPTGGASVKLPIPPPDSK